MINFDLNNFVNFLRNFDINLLPGLNSQIKMAPSFKYSILRNLKATDDAKINSVLIPIIPKIDGFEVLLTLRSQKLNNHRGQISFPGGRKELNEIPIEAALRETHEEVGIPAEKIEVLTTLTQLFVPPSKSLIHPFVGLVNSEYELKMNEEEVEELIFLDFSHLIEESNLMYTKQVIDGYYVDVPFWNIHPTTKLWGATAMILSEFIDIFNLYVKRI